MSGKGKKKMRNDAAFHTNQSGVEIVWQEKNCDYYVIRNGEMRIHAVNDLAADKSIQVIRYTDQLEKFGINTDSELEEWSSKDEEIFSWVNNSWFEIWNDNDSEFYSDAIHDLSEAVEFAKTMEKEKGK
jgi:hypothetical protein